MKKRTTIILLVLFFLLIGGGIIVWKLNQNKESADSSPTKVPLNQLSDQELEKCLLEDFSRRLDLEKYFVFSLGELQTKSPMVGEKEVNWRITKNQLDNDLTKLTVECQKHLEKQGYKSKGRIISKNSIYFFGDNNGNILSIDNDWNKDLDRKITSGNCYILFEKEKNYDWPLGWFTTETDNSGQKWLRQTPAFQLRLKNPSTTICEGKEKALKILKTDPALRGKN